MRTPQASTNPWGVNVDDGWKDLVVSSAPPPPPAPREAGESGVRNCSLPADFATWQEHGSRAAAAAAPIDEPNFTKGDRRLWLVAGTLMGLATLVLAVLGLLTFGNGAAAVTAEPIAAVEAPRAGAGAVEPAHAVVAPRTQASHASAVVASRTPATNPRILKRANRGRHHKRLAAR